MCAVSAVGDNWSSTFPLRHPDIWPSKDITNITEYVPKEDFDKLKKEMEELKKLLLAAKAFDESTGQPDCHMDEKVDLIKKVAKAVGVNVDEVFK